MRRSFTSGRLCCFQLIEAHGCCKPSPDPQLISYLRLPLLSCYWRCCSCLGSQPAPGDAVPAQPGPGRPDLSLPGCMSAGRHGLAAAPCWKLFLVTAPCDGQETSTTVLPAWALLTRPHRSVCAPQREREIQGEKEVTRSKVARHTEEDAKQTGTSRGCVLAADGLCAGCSLVLVLICMTMRSISPSGTWLEESR